MRNRQNTTQPDPAADPAPPTLQSAGTVNTLVDGYQTKRVLVEETWQQADRARQEAENHLRSAQGRRDRLEELRLEMRQVQEEADRYERLGREAAAKADACDAKREEAQKQVADFEQILAVFAPAALAQAQATNLTPPTPPAPTAQAAPTAPAAPATPTAPADPAGPAALAGLVGGRPGLTLDQSNGVKVAGGGSQMLPTTSER